MIKIMFCNKDRHFTSKSLYFDGLMHYIMPYSYEFFEKKTMKTKKTTFFNAGTWPVLYSVDAQTIAQIQAKKAAVVDFI